MGKKEYRFGLSPSPSAGQALPRPRTEVTAHIGLGANLGDPRQALRRAMAQLGTTPGLRLLQASSLYRSAPVDSSGPDYINAVAEVATTLTAPDLLAALQAIEQAAGRERPYVNAPRTLDLDLLLYGSARIDSPLLTVPHPRMQERAFVLLPLHEIAPGLVSAEALRAVAHQACGPSLGNGFSAAHS
jgi:2-amino-4-hydroxy-6-hydroxymethyldihydropteridine diphosphokinase